MKSCTADEEEEEEEEEDADVAAAKTPRCCASSSGKFSLALSRMPSSTNFLFSDVKRYLALISDSEACIVMSVRGER